MLNSWSQLLKKSAWKRSLRLTKTHFICASKLIVFATFSSRTDQLNFCTGIQHDDERNLFTLTQRLFHVLTYTVCILFSRISAILFQPNTARLFPVAIPFPALSILTILLDKQLMKSFENNNILIKVKLFCWKKFFFQKSFYLKKDCHLKEKFFWEEKRIL